MATGFDNYAALQLSVKDWAARGDLSFGNRVADFIRLGEERIWRTLRVADMIETGTPITIADGANSATLPTNWLEFARSVTGVDGQPLAWSPYDALVSVRDGGSGGTVYAYSLLGRTFFLGQTRPTPTPATAGYVLNAPFYKHPGYLADVSTTWLLVKAPSVYLYAALSAGAVFLKNTAKAAEYDALFVAALAALTAQDEAAKVSGATLRRIGRYTTNRERGGY